MLGAGGSNGDGNSVHVSSRATYRSATISFVRPTGASRRVAGSGGPVGSLPFPLPPPLPLQPGSCKSKRMGKKLTVCLFCHPSGTQLDCRHKLAAIAQVAHVTGTTCGKRRSSLQSRCRRYEPPDKTLPSHCAFELPRPKRRTPRRTTTRASRFNCYPCGSYFVRRSEFETAN